MRLRLFTQSNKLTTRDIALIAMMIAIIEVCKGVMAGIPNVELTSFWVILFTLYFGNRIWYVIPAFILLEGLIYGFGIWWIMYLYAWPILALVSYFFRDEKSALVWAIISGAFGLTFGFMCALPYLFIGGPSMAVSWWIAGIPWDLVHGAGNFVIMLVLYHPIRNVMKRIC